MQGIIRLDETTVIQVQAARSWPSSLGRMKDLGDFRQLHMHDFDSFKFTHKREDNLAIFEVRP